MPLPELAAEYARRSSHAPDLARLVVREGLDGTPGPSSDAAQRERFEQLLTDLRRRHEAGSWRPTSTRQRSVWPCFAMCAAPVSFPHLARALGLEPGSPGFAEHYAAEVSRMITHLAGPSRS